MKNIKAGLMSHFARLRIILVGLRLFPILFFLPHVTFAADRFVRPTGGDYGLEDGSSYENAWDGFADIVWGSMGAGDTLYVIGTHKEDLLVRTGGDSTQDFWIRGDHVLGQGTIEGSDILWVDKSNNYVTVYGIRISNGYIRFRNVVSKYSAPNIQLLAPNKIRDFNKEFISRGYKPGMQISLTGGRTSSRLAYLITNITDQGAYEEITIDTTEGAYSLSDEGPGFKGFDSIWPVHHITIDSVKITGKNDTKSLIGLVGTDFTIKNSDLDGKNVDRAGVLYISNRVYYKRHQNIRIENNFIHDGGAVATSNTDEHCIGVQGVDGLVITKNHLKNCGSGIVFWHSGNKPLTNWEVTYNYIEGMDYNINQGQFGGSGIIFSGADNGPNNTGGLVAHNVIVNPKNCPHDPTKSVACRGIQYKLDKLARIYNNVINGNDWGIVIKGRFSADIKNNIVTNSSIYHIISGASDIYQEDYNIYYPDTGTKFLKNGNPRDFAGYNAMYSGTVNANSMVENPSLDSDYKPDTPNSPVIDSGFNLGFQYLKTVTWPSILGGGSFVFAADTVNSEIGAFAYDGSGTTDPIPPAAPTNLTISIVN